MAGDCDRAGRAGECSSAARAQATGLSSLAVIGPRDPNRAGKARFGPSGERSLSGPLVCWALNTLAVAASPVLLGNQAISLSLGLSISFPATDRSSPPKTMHGGFRCRVAVCAWPVRRRLSRPRRAPRSASGWQAGRGGLASRRPTGLIGTATAAPKTIRWHYDCPVERAGGPLCLAVRTGFRFEFWRRTAARRWSPHL